MHLVHFGHYWKSELKLLTFYLVSRQNSNVADIKQLWHFIQNKNRKSKISIAMCFENKEFRNSQEIVNSFTDFLPRFYTSHRVDLTYFTENDILNSL